jgi:hypothetical protein
LYCVLRLGPIWAEPQRAFSTEYSGSTPPDFQEILVLPGKFQQRDHQLKPGCGEAAEMQHHGDGLSITRRLFAHKLSLFFSLMLLL